MTNQAKFLYKSTKLKTPSQVLTEEYPAACWYCPYLESRSTSLEPFGITDALKDFCSRFESKVVDRLRSIYLEDGKDIQCDGASFQKEAMKIEQKNW